MIGNALEGARLTVSEPKNDFEMEADSRYLFIAAGIGVTPIYSMARHADAQGADYRIIYLARSPDTAPYLEEMKEEFGERLQPHFTGGDSAKRYDFWDEFVQPRSERVYCCGPKTLIEEIRDVSGHWPEGKVRFEDFKPVEVVRAEAMRENGIATVSSCESGTCGTCKTRLISGAVDHRDLVLRDDEKKDFIMTCVSRAREGELVLDL